MTVSNESTGLERVVLTDMAGHYRLSGLPIGTYTVRVEKESFQTQIRQSATLAPGSELVMNFSLALGAVPQRVMVTASTARIDNTTATVGGVLTEQSLTGLPLNGRDLFTAAIFEPGVAKSSSSAPSLFSNGKFGQLAVNGMRPSWTDIVIDGMDVREPVFGLSPSGASGLFLGLDEMSEVRVLTQTFDVQYGGVGGGVIEAVTKSGSNQFHGSLFELYRGAALDARNYFDLGKPPLVRNQYGANLGGPLAHNRTFFFVNYEGLNEVQASTAIASVPNALAHRGLLPSNSNPGACTNASLSGCVAIGPDPRIQPFLNLFPYPNGPNHGDGTADLITANKSTTDERHGMVRLDYVFSSTHTLFGRYLIDDSGSLTPSFSTPPGIYVPGFPVSHQGRNQYFTVQDQKSIGNKMVNDFRLGVNRTTALTRGDDTHPGISTSLSPGRPPGTISITNLSLLGNYVFMPLGDYSTNYQVQDQLSYSRGRHTFRFGAEVQKLQSNSFEDLVASGIYTFDDLSPLGIPARSNNAPLESFLEATPLSYVGSDPSNSDSHRSYRQTVASGFAQDFYRFNRFLTFTVGLRYDFYSNPSEEHGRLSSVRDPLKDSGPTVGKIFASTPTDLFSPQAGLAWNLFGDGKTVLRSGAGIFRDRLPIAVLSADRNLPPFYGINSFVLPTFLSPQNALLTLPLYVFTTTYHPKFPYVLQYNLGIEREVGGGATLSAAYVGARGNHLTRQVEQNPFELALGHRLNPNLPSSVLDELTDAQSFYNSLQLSVSSRRAHNLSWKVAYTYAHSVDDASAGFSPEAVNEPYSTQDPFDRKGSRGRSGFDVRHNFVANLVYGTPARLGRVLGGWQASAVANVHSNLPFTPVLSFDNADLQSFVTSERPNLVGNPYTGTCPNGIHVGSPSCWFNPNAFAVPAPGQFGNAGRNILRGPGFTQFDLALRREFRLAEGARLSLGIEAYNLLNHPNFAVPSNTQNALTLGGNGEAIFKDPVAALAPNVGRIFTTIGTGRQIQLAARLTF